MTSSVKLWLKYAGIAIAQRMAYRGEYLISILAMFILELVNPLLAFIIYFNSPGFEGWTLYQLILLQGIFMLVRGTSSVFFYGIVWNSNMSVSGGFFDTVLLKPRNALFLFICQSFDAEDIGKILGGLLLSIYGFSKVDINGAGIIFAIISIIIGIIFIFCLALISSALIFRFTKISRIYELYEILAMIGQYPKAIYPKTIGLIFTFVFPILLAASVPAEALIGSFSLDILISGIVALILLTISLYVWFSAVKRYSSAGG